MEPITISTLVVAGILWENFGQPVLDSAKNKYGDKVLDELRNVLPFKESENEIIETEIVEAIDNKIIKDESSFISFMEQNNTFVQALTELNEVKSSAEIINSFKNISRSKIKINGDSKKILNSFDNISESQIEL